MLVSSAAILHDSAGSEPPVSGRQVVVMETMKQVLGDDHPDTLTSMENLASTYRNQGRWKEAEMLEVVVMEKTKQVLGDDHPDTLTHMILDSDAQMEPVQKAIQVPTLPIW